MNDFFNYLDVVPSNGLLPFYTTTRKTSTCTADIIMARIVKCNCAFPTLFQGLFVAFIFCFLNGEVRSIILYVFIFPIFNSLHSSSQRLPLIQSTMVHSYTVVATASDPIHHGA